MRKMAVIVSGAVLVLGACGNDQSDVADQFIKEANEAGVELDEACVRENAERLSDDDVKALEEGSDRELSPKGEEVLTSMYLQCVDGEDVIEQLLAGIPDDGTVDKECLADALRDIDPQELGDVESSAMVDAMTECMSLGG